MVAEFVAAVAHLQHACRQSLGKDRTAEPFLPGMRYRMFLSKRGVSVHVQSHAHGKKLSLGFLLAP